MLFVKLNNETYAKVIHLKSKREEFIASKTHTLSVPASWKAKFGKYETTGQTYKCTNCIYNNTDDLQMELGEEKGFIVLKTKSKKSGATMYLDTVSDDVAVTGGIGRGTGETVRLLENGNVYYSGYEFVRKK